MVQINLKSIIRKNGTESLIHSILHEIKTTAWIEDDSGRILAGEGRQDSQFSYPVTIEGRVIGYVKGDENALIIANILDHLAIKETERKKLGAEVLNLYQEINMIFNFSEKLAQTIDASSICIIAFQEAMKVIESDSGVIILMDENSKKLQVKATSGESFFKEETINAQLQFLLKIIWGIQSEIITDTSSLAEAGIILPEVHSIIYSALKVNHRVMGVIILGSKEEVNYTAADLKLLTTLALQSSSAMESAFLYEKNIREAQEREQAMRLINEVSGKFVPYEFIGSLGHAVLTDVKLGDQVEKIVTVLFSDIRDYTALSEQMTPEENFKFICSFNERMGPSIRKNNGFINQYLGDAIMAIFPGNASDALCAAIEMQRNVTDFNLERNKNGQQPIQIGVGMHTGPLIMGITGDADRLDATTISDTVNTASRLESLTKQYKTGIILSEASLAQIAYKEKFHLRSLGLVQLKGKQNQIDIHECFSGTTEENIFKKQKTLSTFNRGIYNFLNKSFSAAEQAFLSVAEVDPEDRTAEFFLRSSRACIAGGVKENERINK
ncbi:MAG: GAF domain-containing protein [Phormidesmis sp. FL-bin-119]|nr:GAF domain-containing protein [Pedobacter sp.]